MEAHDRKVADIQNRVQYFYTKKRKIKIYHGGTNSTRPFERGNYQYVNVEDLNNVLEVNKKDQYAIVEPNVSLDKLADTTLKHGLVPPMVAEFPGITVGGAIQGGSGESSSFKWGGFHDTCLEYEVVLGDGTKRTVSRTKDSELFWGLACAYGTLGIITLVKIKLVPSTKYVKLTYYPAVSYKAATHKILELTDSKVDFIEGILLGRNRGVILAGEYTNQKQNLKLISFHRAIDEWFYIHVKKMLKKSGNYEEVVLLRDYLFRYDKGAFWTASYGFQAIPFNRITRFIFSSFLNTRTLYKVLLGSNYAYKYLVQDICLPSDKVVPFLDFIEQQYAIFPLWLCPLKPGKYDKLSPNLINTDMVINVGVWGPVKQSDKSFTSINKELEKKVIELGGRKVLYAHSYYSEAEFWHIYNRKYYEGLRKKYNADISLPDVYSKTATPLPKFKPSKWRGFIALFNSPYNQ